MKWRRETIVYMWANYFSEDGRWKAWDTSEMIESNRKTYDPIKRKFVPIMVNKHVWHLQNLQTGETLAQEFKTLKAAKEYAEAN